MGERKYKHLMFMIVVILLFTTMQNTSGEIPQQYTFEDETDDATYWRFTPGSGSLSPERRVGFEFAEIVSASYELVREEEYVKLSLTTLDTPLVNSSIYYSFNMELEQENIQKLRMTITHSSLGFSAPSNQTKLDIFLQNPDGEEEEFGDIETHLEDDTLYWIIPNSPIDIIRVFDNPLILITIVRVELEYSLGGSSSFGGGDYIRDIILRETFDFEGGVLEEREGFFEVIDIYVLGIYVAVPVILLTVRRIKS